MSTFNRFAKPYTAVGSRDTPEDILVLQHHVGKIMCDLGWHGFSGLAEGPDSIYYGGAKCSDRFKEIGFTNIIPWNGFSGSKTGLIKHKHDPNNDIFNLAFSSYKKRAMWLALGARGTDKGLSSGGLALHSRNAMQVLDINLKRPSRLVHCWAPPIGISGHVKGGTGTAVALGIHFGIDIINLATKAGLKRTLDFLKLNNVEIDYDHYLGVAAGYKL